MEWQNVEKQPFGTHLDDNIKKPVIEVGGIKRNIHGK